MKKKIKDLTVIEIASICKKYKSCLDCPLNNEHRICDLPCNVEEEDLEQEVEIDE